MSVLEIWGAEYQENDCLLIKPESRGLMEAICERERCFMQVRYFSVVTNLLHCVTLIFVLWVAALGAV
jgi:phosphoribosylformylglycinamidine (FGAM) synthase-like enzyme